MKISCCFNGRFERSTYSSDIMTNHSMCYIYEQHKYIVFQMYIVKEKI